MKNIFITHSSFETSFVKGLKKTLEKTFSCKVFAFQESLRLGDEWIGTIRKNLEEADLHIIVLSPISVGKLWTYFEAGGTWLKEKETQPILMRFCLSEDEIPPSNPLSNLWHGDFFKKKDVEGLFDRIKERIPLKNEKGEGMKAGFVECVTSAMGDKYKIFNAFKKIMEKNIRKEPNVFPLHKQGIAPVPAILYEAFGKNYLEEKLNAEVDNKPNGNYHISTYSPAKLGEMVKCFKDLTRQGYVKRVETPLEKFLKKTIRKVEKRANFPSEVPEILFKEEKVLNKIDTEKKPLKGLKQYPIADEDDLVTFLQTAEVIGKINTVVNKNTGFSPAKIWKSTIDSTKKWWDEYTDYFTTKAFNIGDPSGDLDGRIMGSFHSLLWYTHYKELGDFLRSWYKILS